MMLKLMAAAAATFVAMAMSAGAASAQEIYLKSSELPGDSKDQGREGQVRIISMTDGVGGTPANAGGARAGMGRINFSDINLVKFVDSSSLKLREFAATGKRIEKIDIDFAKPGANKDKEQLIYRVTLKNAVVTSVATSAAANGGNVVTESLTLGFEEITWTIPKYRPDGTFEELKFGWSIPQNRKL